MRRFLKSVVVSLVVVGFVALGCVTGVAAKDIKVGAIINLTGHATGFEVKSQGLVVRNCGFHRL